MKKVEFINELELLGFECTNTYRHTDASWDGCVIYEHDDFDEIYIYDDTHTEPDRRMPVIGDTLPEWVKYSIYVSDPPTERFYKTKVGMLRAVVKLMQEKRDEET